MTAAHGSSSAPSSRLPAPVLLEERRDATALLTLNRPEARNALSRELVAALSQALARLGADPSVRSVVLTGSGAAFCGGADLKTLRDLEAASAADFVQEANRFKDLFHLLGAFPKPVIGAVNGPALAGGCGLASLCDVVLACPEATFGYPEVKIGFVAAMVLVFLARQIGERRAKELLLTGRLLGAEEAVALGVATRIVSREGLLDMALDTARGLHRGAPSSLALTKELLWRTAGLSLDSALGMAACVNAFSRTGPDVREGVSAFLDKRKPSWTGEP